jgi:hypothetical protein
MRLTKRSLLPPRERPRRYEAIVPSTSLLKTPIEAVDDRFMEGAKAEILAESRLRTRSQLPGPNFSRGPGIEDKLLFGSPSRSEPATGMRRMGTARA